MKILIADDSSFVRSIIAKTIRTHFKDSEIMMSVDGREALDSFSANEPDLLITDLLMPNMNGQELIRNVKAKRPDMRVIVISADIQNATRQELDEIGVDCFINKPMTPEKFEILIDVIRGNDNA